MTMRERLGRWAAAAKRELTVAYLAARDPRVPWYAKLLAAAAVAYALSPIDLIPDFIPVLGYLDDLLLVPLALLLVVRLIPPEVLADLRRRAETARMPASHSRAAVVVIVAVWSIVLAALVVLAVRWLPG